MSSTKKKASPSTRKATELASSSFQRFPLSVITNRFQSILRKGSSAASQPKKCVRFNLPENDAIATISNVELSLSDMEKVSVGAISDVLLLVVRSELNALKSGDPSLGLTFYIKGISTLQAPQDNPVNIEPIQYPYIFKV
jgi:hypothetical protein